MNDRIYGDAPRCIGDFGYVDLPEVMYYLYLPVVMQPPGVMRLDDIRLPPNVECCRNLIAQSIMTATMHFKQTFQYVYLSARKGWATPDNPLNRPGWHCDGFGTDDLNFVWWRGPGTRFLTGRFTGISDDHVMSLAQFERIANEIYGRPASENASIVEYDKQAHLWAITPTVIHATPEIEEGCMRQYVKVSLSNHRYNLKDNSHNYLFDYDWPMHERATIRNDTDKAQRDYV